MISSLIALGIIRASVKNDYRGDVAFQKRFSKKLGYNDYFSDAKNGNHYSMFLFIRAFAKNLTPELREKILAKGLDPHLLDRIVFNSRQLETFKECFDIERVYGTFASQKDILPKMTINECAMFERLKDYYDSNLLSVLFAPLHPEASRNCQQQEIRRRNQGASKGANF
jgi:hypothetical protein